MRSIFLSCLSSLLLLQLFAGNSHGARILGVVPFPATSHQLPLRQVMLHLASRGHQVTFITTDPIGKPVKNYTEIDMSFIHDWFRSTFGNTDNQFHWSLEAQLHVMDLLGIKICELELDSSQMAEFLKSEPTFDLMIVEQLLIPCYFGLAHRVGSPILVGYTSLEAPPHILESYGNPHNPAYNLAHLPYTDHMTFWQRLHNTYMYLRVKYWYYYSLIPKQERIQRKYFGDGIPSISETERNFSLLLSNNHFSVHYPRPLLPNTIELTGLQVEEKRKPLPKDIQEWLDGAKEGVIYVSLGSHVKSSSLPEEKRKALLSVFSRLPQRILWKWETDNLPGKPDNVKIAKWMPQQDVLAHPNIKVFITHCGLQSLNEAIYHAVPLVAMPIFADQPHNAVKMVDAGVAAYLDYETLTEASVNKALRSVLDDKSYASNMRRLSAVFREHQSESLSKAAWWIEYLLRHGGAPHLRSAALDLSWWQLLLLDVALFVVAAFSAVLLALYVTARALLSAIRKRRNPAAKDKQH